MKPVILSALMLACIAFGVAMVPVCEWLDRIFSPLQPGAASSVVPGCFDFSSPSSEVGVDSSAPAFFISTMDLQRALNQLYPELKLKEDGVYGPLTKAAHERACGDQSVRATWPSDELVVKEVK